MDQGRVGVDESGKGDFFGPLVVAACYVGPEHLAELEGVKDSKKLTDKQAIELATQIKKVCPYKVLPLMPLKYNELYAKIGNLNYLLAWGHATVIEDVLNLHPADLIISDQFATGGNVVKSRLKEKGRQAQFVSRVRAESDIAVAAASILARAEFLWRLRELSQQFGIDLPKGATNVIPSGKKFVQLHGPDALKQVAKMHFKTSKEVLNG
jgi:ribonuclease HIII